MKNQCSHVRQSAPIWETDFTVYWKIAMKCFIYSLLTCLAKPWLAFKNNLTLCLRHQNSCAMGLRAPQSQTGEWKLVSRYKSEVLPNMLLWACNDPASSSVSVASTVAFAGSRILNHCNIWHAGSQPWWEPAAVSGYRHCSSGVSARSKLKGSQAECARPGRPMALYSIYRAVCNKYPEDLCSLAWGSPLLILHIHNTYLLTRWIHFHWLQPFTKLQIWASCTLTVFTVNEINSYFWDRSH